MKFKIIDYNIEKHCSLDEWIDETKHSNAKLINKYATYNEPISDAYKYFLDNPFKMANIKSFIKIFENKDIVYGIVVFHYYNEKNVFYLAINPLIINPKFINLGIGTKILNQIVIEAKDIAKGHVDIIKADTEETNLASIKIFKKCNFIDNAKNDNFIEYIYELVKK